MREIKFRYIVGDEKGKVKSVHYDIYLEDIEQQSRRYLSVLKVIIDGGLLSRDEWAGLKDKNGKDIYEGDIVHIEIPTGISSYNYNGEVMFISSEFVFKNFKYIKGNNRYGLGREYDGFNIGHYSSICLRVIGNKFENPELMNIPFKKIKSNGGNK